MKGRCDSLMTIVLSSRGLGAENVPELRQELDAVDRFRHVVGAAVAERGLDVLFFAARDGVEGVAKAKSEKPDVILLDVMMPNMNGLDACAAIRADEAIAHIPIVMV